MKKKSPYRGYTEKEVSIMESNYFVLSLGGDFVLKNKFYLFNSKEVTKLYNDTLKNLISIVEDGDDKDRKYALDLIGGLVIQRMRLH